MRSPSLNPITLPFGATSDPYTAANPHKGTDFAYTPDDIIYAPADGVVRLIPNNGNDGNGIYMNAEEAYLGMLHTSKYLVENGAYVTEGQPIAIMGNTGYVLPRPTPENPRLGTHLHWAAKVNGQFVDPMSLVNQGGGMPTTEEILQSALNDARKTNEILASALNASRASDEVHASALNATRAENEELKKQLAVQGTTLKPGKYVVGT